MKNGIALIRDGTVVYIDDVAAVTRPNCFFFSTVRVGNRSQYRSFLNIATDFYLIVKQAGNLGSDPLGGGDGDHVVWWRTYLKGIAEHPEMMEETLSAFYAHVGNLRIDVE